MTNLQSAPGKHAAARGFLASSISSAKARLSLRDDSQSDALRDNVVINLHQRF